MERLLLNIYYLLNILQYDVLEFALPLNVYDFWLGKFNENIFFITFAKAPKLNIIVQKIYQHTGYPVPEFQSDEDTFNQLEYLMKQIVKKGPILLVLDDVWLESVSLVDNFVFEIPNYKILVTSRFAIGRFGHPFVLKPLSEAHAINLFKHSASLTKTSSDIPDDVVKEVICLILYY
jgi:hypothetical protein